MARNIYTGTAGGGGGVGALNVISNTISTLVANENIILDPGGTGVVRVNSNYTARANVDSNTVMPRVYMDKNVQPGLMFINLT